MIFYNWKIWTLAEEGEGNGYNLTRYTWLVYATVYPIYLTSHSLQGTRNTRPCLTGHLVFEGQPNFTQRIIYFKTKKNILCSHRKLYQRARIVIISYASHCFPIFKVSIDWRYSYQVYTSFLPAFSIGKQWEAHHQPKLLSERTLELWLRSISLLTDKCPARPTYALTRSRR